MDAKQERELFKRLSLPPEPQVTLADRLPIGVERVVGLTLLVATYYVTGMILPLVVTAIVGVSFAGTATGVMGMIFARSIGIGYLICLGWLVLWFLVYVATDLKEKSTLARIPGAPDDLEDLGEELPKVKKAG